MELSLDLVIQGNVIQHSFLTWRRRAQLCGVPR